MYFVVFALFLAHFCSKRMKIFKKNGIYYVYAVILWKFYLNLHYVSRLSLTRQQYNNLLN